MKKVINLQLIRTKQKSDVMLVGWSLFSVIFITDMIKLDQILNSSTRSREYFREKMWAFVLGTIGRQHEYRKVSNIRRTKSQNLNASRLIL